MLTNDIEKWQHLSKFERYLLTQLWGYTTDEYKYKARPKTRHNLMKYAYFKGMASNTFFTLNHYHKSKVNFFKKCRIDIIKYAKWNMKNELQQAQTPMKVKRPANVNFCLHTDTVGRRKKLKSDKLN